MIITITIVLIVIITNNDIVGLGVSPPAPRRYANEVSFRNT